MKGLYDVSYSNELAGQADIWSKTASSIIKEASVGSVVDKVEGGIATGAGKYLGIDKAEQALKTRNAKQYAANSEFSPEIEASYEKKNKNIETGANVARHAALPTLAAATVGITHLIKRGLKARKHISKAQEIEQSLGKKFLDQLAAHKTMVGIGAGSAALATGGALAYGHSKKSSMEKTAEEAEIFVKALYDSQYAQNLANEVGDWEYAASQA